MNLINKLRRYNVGKFHKTGFHGDTHLISTIDHLTTTTKVKNFIETGTNLGSTLRYFANKYPNINCYSCEPNEYSFKKANKHLSNCNNAKIYNCTSTDFWKDLLSDFPTSHAGRALFWLDSHGYGFSWPLIEEVNYILANWSECFILIDDFKVPNNPQFKYDQYDGQVCSYDYIKSGLKHNNFELYYPNYKEKTSSHHPLKGWGLIVKSESLNIDKVCNLSILTKAII